MPLIHVDCGGVISFWSRRCETCGKVWPPKTLLSPIPPTDMYFIPSLPGKEGVGDPRLPTTKDIPSLTKGLVSRLPKWPRWARILTVVILLVIFTVGPLILLGRLVIR
jgi:hypothetical protein